MGRDREKVIDLFFTNVRLIEGGTMKSLLALVSGILELGVVKRENV